MSNIVTGILLCVAGTLKINNEPTANFQFKFALSECKYIKRFLLTFFRIFYFLCNDYVISSVKLAAMLRVAVISCQTSGIHL